MADTPLSLTCACVLISHVRYVLPEDSATLVAVQALVAVTCTLGGAALWGAAQFLGKLQK